MNNIKMITLFHPHDKTPFMICIVNKVEDTELGLKLTLENGNSICVNNYDHYLSKDLKCIGKHIINIFDIIISCMVLNKNNNRKISCEK